MRSRRQDFVRPHRRSPGVARTTAAPSLRRGLAATSFAVLAATGLATELLFGNAALAAGEPLEVSLNDVDGDVVGTVTLTGLPGGGVLVDATFDGLPPGVHGFHIHETGACDPADGFASAGGHLTGGSKHGFLVEGGPHAGDMPNIHVPESGELRVEIFAALVTLDADGPEGLAPLLDADGASLMVHIGADDYMTQSSGHAGDRVACAVIGGA